MIGDRGMAMEGDEISGIRDGRIFVPAGPDVSDLIRKWPYIGVISALEKWLYSREVPHDYHRGVRGTEGGPF
jgi:hypothetical protein